MTVNEEVIEKWAKENVELAKALGKRLIENAKTPEAMRSLPSLGDVQDRIQEWAIANQPRARILLLRLVQIVMK